MGLESIIIVVIGLALLILVHEWGHFFAAKKFNLLVEEFGIGFPPRLFSRKKGETVYSVNLIPLGGFVKIYGENAHIEDHIQRPERSFAFQKAWKRAIVILAGVFMNFIFGWLLISFVFFVGAPSVIIVDQVVSNSPAALAGIEKGDKVLGFSGVNSLVNFINQNKGKEISFKISRGEEELVVKTAPRADFLPEEGALGVGLRGVELPRSGFIASLGKGFIASAAIIFAIFAGLYNVFLHPASVVGPVGIIDIAINTGQLGIIYLLQFISLISLNLVVLNILPIPALDGGRLLFIIIEKIRGKKFSAKAELRANAWGFAILFALIILVTAKDIAGLL